MLDTVTVRRVVLIADSAVEQIICREVERLGFLAYSSVHCSGGGSRSVIPDIFSATSHVRIEALGSPDLVRRLMRFVDDHLARRYSIVCFTDAVEVSASTAAA